MLLDHRPMDAQEGRHLDRMHRFAKEASDPFDGGASTGHFTASALVVSPDLEQVLLLHHRRLDRWLQCGGHVEASDPDPAAAALRETREETGISAVRMHPLWDHLLDVDIHKIPDSTEMAAHPHLDLRYLVAADPEAPLRAEEREVKALEWCDWDEARARIDDPGLERLFAKVHAIRGVIQRTSATNDTP